MMTMDPNQFAKSDMGQFDRKCVFIVDILE